MMDNLQFLSMILAFLPIAVGITWRVAQISNSSIKSISLTTVVVSGALLAFTVDIDPSSKLLAFAVLGAGLCVILCQEESQQVSQLSSSSMIILGLALGALLVHGFGSRLFLCGLLGYAAFSLTRKKYRSFRTTFTIIHFIIAIILSLSSSFGGNVLQMYSGLFLAITFLPLVPFHLPFVDTVQGAKGNLSSFWVVIWLAIGLAELNIIYSELSLDILLVISLLALVSAFYASLAALGQKQINLFIASATVAHVSLVWGLINVFPGFSKWGIGFGVAVALVLGGICLAFSFVRQRYGWQKFGNLPGLASPMPLLGIAMVLLVSFALFLPMLPTFTGLTAISSIDNMEVKFFIIFLIYLAVWVGGGWFFLQMLHQTVFGTARRNIPYSDLRVTEFVAITVLLLGAGYSGFLY